MGGIMTDGPTRPAPCASGQDLTLVKHAGVQRAHDENLQPGDTVHDTHPHRSIQGTVADSA
ncbi:MAG: hypothetical protein Q8K22_00620, partial [Rhodoferax sp.]|nr:hypothetical protein [Rhodoferax sp.]